MKKILIAGAVLLALSACKNINRETLGMSNKAPDEFMVAPRPPLSLPPEYDLRPVSEPSDAAEKPDLTDSEQGLLDRIENN